jgi:8-oxo-dGTP diphosphatase
VHEYPDFELTMHSYICEVQTKELILHEHIAQEWLTIKELNKLNWAAADIPIVNKLVMNG